MTNEKKTIQKIIEIIEIIKIKKFCIDSVYFPIKQIEAQMKH